MSACDSAYVFTSLVSVVVPLPYQLSMHRVSRSDSHCSRLDDCYVWVQYDFYLILCCWACRSALRRHVIISCWPQRTGFTALSVSGEAAAIEAPSNSQYQTAQTPEFVINPSSNLHLQSVFGSWGYRWPYATVLLRLWIIYDWINSSC